MRALLLLAVGGACGRLDFALLPDATPDTPALGVEVDFQHSTLGARWLVPSEPGTDMPCTFEHVWYSACDHPAERLLVRVTDTSLECASLEYGDALGAFDWRCRRDGDALVFESLGLRHGAGLRTLVDENGWKPNRFVATAAGVERFASTPDVWWTNPVVPLPDNSTSGTTIALDASETIYVLASSRATAGYSIDADRIAVVMLDGAVLSFGGGAANCGESQSVNAQCLITAMQRRHGIWIEGELDGRGPLGAAQYGVLLSFPFWSRLRGVHVHHVGTDGFYTGYGESLLLEDVVATDNGRHGISDRDSYITGRHLVAANNNVDGIHARSIGVHAYTDVRSFNNGNAGIMFVSDAAGLFSDVITAHNNGAGIVCDNAYVGGAWHSIAAIGNGGNGVEIHDLTSGSLNRILSANNQGDGLWLDQHYQAEHAHLVIANNSNAGVRVTDAYDALFLWKLLVGNNDSGDCLVTGGMNPGIDGTCDSMADLTTAVDLRGSFVGGGVTAPAGTITSWTAQLGAHQVWGRAAGSALDQVTRGRCLPPAQCQVWDYGLAVGDTILANAAGTPFVEAAACPAAAGGDAELSVTSEDCFSELYSYPQRACPRTYLINALEIIDDHVGNDDGFCESDERCEYLPHLTAFRGRGARYAEPCVFSDVADAVSGVTLYGYAP